MCSCARPRAAPDRATGCSASAAAAGPPETRLPPASASTRARPKYALRRALGALESDCRTARGSGRARGSRSSSADARAAARHGLVDLRAPAARAAAAVLTRQQQLGDLLRDRRSALDDAPRAQVVHGRARDARSDRRRRASGSARLRPRASRATSVGGSVAASSASPRVPERRPRLVQTLAVPIDDDVVDGRSSSSSRPGGSGPQAQPHARARRRRAASSRVAGAADEAHERCACHADAVIVISIDRPAPARPFTSGAYISSARRARDAERAGRGRAHEVRELVAAFAEPRREQRDAVVVLLDVIEAAAAVARLPRLVVGLRTTRPCARSDAVVRNQLSTASTPAGSGSVTAT